MDKHPVFTQKVMDKNAEMSNGLDKFIAAALLDGLTDIIPALFKHGLAQADSNRGSDK